MLIGLVAVGAGPAAAQIKVGGNVYGGGELGKVTKDATVTVNDGTVTGSVFGGGQGTESDETKGQIEGNTLVKMTGGQVERSVYGGGELASVGTFEGAYTVDESTLHVEGEPKACKSGTGRCQVQLSGGWVGVKEKAHMPNTTHPGDDEYGYVFAGSMGIADSETYAKANLLAICGSTELEVSGTAVVTASVYGGSANGEVLGNTNVKISGGQIGLGYYKVDGVEHWDDPYAEELWTKADQAAKDGHMDTYYDTLSTKYRFHECDHWLYQAPYEVYDIYGIEGGSTTATDGHTFFGCVFGGGSGYYPYAEGKWRRSAGRVLGDTRVEISGGHVLTSVYGGNEQTDVLGTSSVVMTGGTVGVPRTIEEIQNHPVTCNVFGAGKGDERVRFNQWTNVASSSVEISGGTVFGSVFGGGEDGHVLANAAVVISGTAFVGTWGTSYADGNVFGSGRGFGGDALTAGNVGGNVTVEISGGRMLGSVYGGGRLASVGTHLVDATESDYGKLVDGSDHGVVTVSISGTAVIGNDYEYVANPTAAVKTATMPLTVFATDGTTLRHTKGGNVFAGSMGRLLTLSGAENPRWPGLAKVKTTRLTVSGGTIKSNIYGGGELGSVAGDTRVTVTAGTIGTSIGSGDDQYYFGAVYGAGYGSDDHTMHTNDSSAYADVLAGRVYGSTTVSLTGGTVQGDVYGGGEMASVGYKSSTTLGNTLVNIGNESQAGHDELGVTILGSVYGANNISGTPMGNTDVNIYSTAHTTANSFPYPAPETPDELASNALTQGYAIKAVFGGGNHAPHAPNAANGTTKVHVYYCAENTIGDVYGGGNAASTVNNNVVIDGGRINRVFGGGNGEGEPANVSGTAATTIRGGLIDTVFGGSNNQGTIGTIALTTEEGPCSDNSIVGQLFGGGNRAPGAGGTLDIACGTGKINTLYGGSNKAVINGDLKLNIRGGDIDYVFGGSRGDTVSLDPAKSHGGHIHGDVTVNLYGGTLGDVYGGGNINGVIDGIITVNIDSIQNTCPLTISGNVYGGGNLTPTYGTVATRAVDVNSPVVNIKHGSVGIYGATVDADHGNVYGAGHGQGSRVRSNPKVVIGNGTYTGSYAYDHDADGVETTQAAVSEKPIVYGNVYGAGMSSRTFGHTTVEVQDGLVHGDVFGGGRGLTIEERPDDAQIATRAIVDGWTTIKMTDGTVRGNIYGGGEIASVGHYSSTAQNNGTEWSDYDSRSSDVKGKYGNTYITISGGIVGPGVKVMDKTDVGAANLAFVYGGGKGIGGNRDADYKDYTNVTNTSVTVNGGHIFGSVFGGAEDGHVTGNTNVYIQPGAFIGTEGYTHEYDGCVLGGGRNDGNKTNVDHLHAPAGRVGGNTNVTVTGGRILRSVFGGGAMARVGVDVDGGVDSYVSGTVYSDSTLHGTTNVSVSGDTVVYADQVAFEASDHYALYKGTTRTDASGRVIVYLTAIGAPDGELLVDNDYTIGDIFGGGKGDTKDTLDFIAGRVMNTYVVVSGAPRVMADIYAGAEMGSVGWWDTNRYVGAYGSSATNANHNIDYSHTGYTHVTISDNPYTGTPYEFSTANYIGNRKAWTLVDALGRLTHTCSGNVYGGGQGYVEEDATHRTNWVHMGRVRHTNVTISGGRFMGNVFGGGSRGIVKEDCHVTVTGGRIGCIIQDASTNTDDTPKYHNGRYFYGSVFGGGYGNPKSFSHLNDSSFVTSGGARVAMIPTEQAGRVYGNTYVNISGGQILDCVYGGGDIASTGWVERDPATGRYLFEDASKRHGGVCTVNITGNTVVGPLDYFGHNAYVYGAGRGVDVDQLETYKLCANVNETHLIVNLTTSGAPEKGADAWDAATDGGRIWGSLFGGGADCHVLGNVYTTLSAGLVGTDGTTTWDGNIFGGGRNYHNSNHTNGRVQGNISVIMKGGTILGSIFGGGRMALSGVNVDGFYPSTDWTIADHGNVDIKVSGTAHIGTDNAVDLLVNDESVGDIFGSGKGDTKNYQDVFAGRVTNTKITITDSPIVRGGVYGGGEMASVGWWDDTIMRGTTVVNTGSGTDYGRFYDGTGITEVYVYGSPTIGTAAEYQYTDPENPGNWTEYADGRLTHACTGNVYGGCQGDVDPTAPRWISMGRSNQATVVIGKAGDAASTPRIMGEVYGGAEQGLVVKGTAVTVNGGTIGTRITALGEENAYYFGSVYGGGYGSTDIGIDNDSVIMRDASGNPVAGLAGGMIAGRVYGTTQVDIHGGHIYKNVYGGGSMANVGWVDMYTPANMPVMHTATGDSAHISWPYQFAYTNGDCGKVKVNIDGGRIGVDGQGNGNVYGASRGLAGDRYAMSIFASLVSTEVNIDYATTAEPSAAASTNGDAVKTACIVGSVYGGGENGHVYDNAVVNISGGLVGHSVYGAGSGTDTYLDKLWDPATEAPKATAEPVHDIIAGKVYGNTEVNILGGHVLHNVYGGGEMASVGKGNYHGYGETDLFIDDHKATTGKATVNIYGGTIGTEADADHGHVFGSSKGTTFATVEKNPRINYSRDFFLGYTNTTDVVIGDPEDNTSNPRIYGSVFGGGEDGHVRFDAKVTVNGGTIGVSEASADANGLRGNVYGAGRGIDYIPSTTDYSPSAGSVTCSTTVDIKGGTIYRNVYGGGSMATVGPPPTYSDPSFTQVNVSGGTLGTADPAYGGNVYGSSRGLQSNTNAYAVNATCAETEVNILAGATVPGNVYGGGENGHVGGDATVNVTGGKVQGATYGGGQGVYATTGYTNDTTSGRIYGNTKVNILGGTVNDVYGGCARSFVGTIAANALKSGTGATLVNIGSAEQAGRIDQGPTVKGSVFGANNAAGTPYGDAQVHVYHTAHTTDDPIAASDGTVILSGDQYPSGLHTLEAPADILTAADIASTKLTTQNRQDMVADKRYAIAAVYGGGNLAAHEPKSTDGTTLVHIHYCSENTIRDVYGGGNAASTRNNHVVVEGGRVKNLFGGGNGYGATNPGADVHGTAHTEIHGGIFDSIYGGSNAKGYVDEIVLVMDNDGQDGADACEELIANAFGGGNMAEGEGGVITLSCGVKIDNFYAGANNANVGSREKWDADQHASIVLNIEGGTYANVYGGNNQGGTIYGDVTVNYHGGNIQNLFGGNNAGGNVFGSITVNVDVDPEYICADGLRLDNVYGGGRDASYRPFDPFHATPAVNIMNNRFAMPSDENAALATTGAFTDHTEAAANDSAFVKIQDIFGGGYGPTALIVSYPRVVVGGFAPQTKVHNAGTAQEETVNITRQARVYHNIYGGGNAAPLDGNTSVLVRDAVVGTATDHIYPDGGMVFGGGFGPTSTVQGNTLVGIYGLSDIMNNVYGGGNAGVVTGQTHVEMSYLKQVFPPVINAYDDNGTIMARLVVKDMDVDAIYYTTDGSQPDINDPNQRYTAPFAIDFDHQVQAIAVKEGYIPSPVMTPQSVPPVITIDDATLKATFDGTIGSKIYYTLDGTDPATSATRTLWGTIGEGVAPAPVEIPVADVDFVVASNGGTTGTGDLVPGHTLRAMAEMLSCTPSPTTFIQADQPVITLSGNVATITAKAGERIIFTLEGTTPASMMDAGTLVGQRTGETVNSDVWFTNDGFKDEFNLVDFSCTRGGSDCGVVHYKRNYTDAQGTARTAYGSITHSGDGVPTITITLPTSHAGTRYESNGIITIKAVTEHDGYAPSQINAVVYRP